jgi:hypothetical protein
MDLHDRFEDQRDRFEIIAFHDASAKTFDELDEKLAKTVEEVWKRPLPFPILLDDSGDTIERYGIRAFPTVILIDPDGKLVKGRAEKLLEAKLTEMSASAK